MSEAHRDEIGAALLDIASLGWRAAPVSLESIEPAAGFFGTYVGLPPRIELLADGRKARLLASLSFVQGDGTEWLAPVGSELDGASIPWPLWSIIGGPFEGQYRDASIVHDYYCVSRTRSWSDTHRMFYDGMRCSGVSEVKAKIMYYAVYRFGPRWPTPGLESVTVATAQPELSASNARSLAADAEAIYTQHLSLREIKALADARNSVAPPGSVLEGMVTESAGPSALDRARLLVVIGGTGSHEDLEAVAREAAALPAFVLARFERKKMRLIACRGNITDYKKAYRNKIPRGWESTGKTWNDVPGAYFPDEKNVVIATIEESEGRVVPTSASRLHGSASLVVHESLHGFDYAGNHVVLSDPQFLSARNGDFARLDAYEQQGGQAGLEETFAESGARYACGREPMRTQWPHLFAYWDTGTPTGWLEGVPLGTMAEHPPVMAESAGEGALGTAERTQDGTITLDLRAEDAGGAVGHALLTIQPQDAAHGTLQKRLFGTPGLEATVASKVLFRP